MPRSNGLRAGLLMVTGACLTACDAAIVKIVATEMHPLQIYFFRCLVAFAVLMPIMMRRGPVDFRTDYLPQHALRAVVKLAGLVTLMFAITMLPLATVTAIGFAAPLFVSLGAMALFREKAQAARLVALMTGFAGVLVVVRPASGFLELGMTVALGAAMLTASSSLLMKFSSSREPATKIVLLNLVISIPIALAVALPVWVWPSPNLLALLALQGAIAALCQVCYVKAYSLADATALMPFEFLRLPFAIIIALILFAESPDLWTIVGAAIIFAAGFAAIGRRQRGPLTP